MNREIKADWVEALKSGEYVQTKGTLNRVSPGTFVDGNVVDSVTEEAPIGFCCLGVLCDRLAKKYPEKFSWGEATMDGDRMFDGVAQYGWYDEETDNTTIRLEEVAVQAELNGIARVDGIDLDDQQNDLVSMNDEGTAFAEIAAWIEENVKEDDTPLPF